MNIFFENYAQRKNSGISKKEWEEFGYRSLVRLFEFLGVHSDKDLYEIAYQFQYQEFKSGFSLLEENQLARKIYFVISGTVKIFSKINGVEIIKSLVNQGNLVTSVKFLTNEPSDIFIETCSKCRLLVIDAQDLLHLMNNGWGMEIMMIQQVAILKGILFTSWISDLRQLDGLDSIKMLRDRCPQIFESFSDKNIAGLLGLSPSTYSKLNRKPF